MTKGIARIHWTPELDALLSKMWAAGDGHGRIALAINCSQSENVITTGTVETRRKALGLPTRVGLSRGLTNWNACRKASA